MKSPALIKRLLMLNAITLMLQSIQPVAAQTPPCIPGKCVYLALVSRTPYLLLTHDIPERRKLDFQVECYIFNTTDTRIKDIVVRAEFTEYQIPVVVYTYTLPFDLPPGRVTPFMLYVRAIDVDPPIVNLEAITWTVASDSEN